MLDFNDGVVFAVWDIITGDPVFNYYFTVVSVFAVFGITVAQVAKVISRS